MTTIFYRSCISAQRTDWLRSAAAGIAAMQSMKASVESMNVVLRHRDAAIHTMRAVIEDCVEAGRILDDDDEDLFDLKLKLTEILRRVSDIADMYAEMGKEVMVAETQSAKAVSQLASWLSSTLP